MTNFNDYLKERLQDPEFKKEYDALCPEFSIVQAMIDARLASGLTQKQLSERTGIAQADISKLENSTALPCGANPICVQQLGLQTPGMT